MNYYIATDRFGNYDLAHHGILGQKWGIRRFQNKDGSLTIDGKKRYFKEINRKSKVHGRPDYLDKAHIIPAGTKVFRTTTKSNGDLPEGSTYISYLDQDRNHYKNGYIRYRDQKDAAYEHMYSLQKDLNIPSKDTLKNAVLTSIKNNPKLKDDIVNGWLDMALPKGSMKRYYASIDQNTDTYSEKVWKKYVDDAIKSFGNMSADDAFFYTCQSLGMAKKAKESVISDLSSKGYNAMPDFASIGGHNQWWKEGVEPLIVFDSRDLNSVASKKISAKEERAAAIENNKWTGTVNRDKWRR